MKGIRLVKIVWSIMLLSFLGACGEKENEDKRTLIFSRYMDQAFGVKIPEEQQFYVIVPSSGCQGAIGIALIEINEPTLQLLVQKIIKLIKLLVLKIVKSQFQNDF